MAVEIVVRQNLEKQFNDIGGKEIWNPNSGYYYSVHGGRYIPGVNLNFESTGQQVLDPVSLGLTAEELQTILKSTQDALAQQLREYLDYWNKMYDQRVEEALSNQRYHSRDEEPTRRYWAEKVEEERTKARRGYAELQWKFVSQLLQSKTNVTISTIVSEAVSTTLGAMMPRPRSCKAVFG
jgi:hypothetical protein